jgi:Protein of unknown function (DUF4197)
MKKIFAVILLVVAAQATNAQGLLDKLKKAVKTDSSKNILTTIKNGNTKSSGTGLSNGDIISGLKDALRVATDTTAKTLSAAGGYFKNEAIKIIMPAEAVNAEQKLRAMGAGKLVDKAILTMNTAAENAASEVGPIFLTAIKQMTLTDGLSILRGGDNAATNFLKNATTNALIEKMKPVILSSLQKVNADKAWDAVFSKYNMFTTQKVNTDLTAYVTQKALDGMFFNIALQEQKIRKDPAAQVTDILKKVFAK